MKRIICTVLALTLLGSTAASARDWGGHGGGYRGYHHHNGGGAALGLGLGILALGIIASQNGRDHDRYDRDDNRDGAYDRGDDGYRGNDGYRGEDSYRGNDGYRGDDRNGNGRNQDDDGDE